MTPLALVLLTCAILVRRHRRRARRAPEPSLEDAGAFHLGGEQLAELDIDAQSQADVEAAQDLARVDAEIDQFPDDDRAFDEGQNWVEALETSAVENGPEPELPLDELVDDEDVYRPPHASDARDLPVADRGSGGVRGL